MQKIITICSPKGGTGKTTLAQNLAVLFHNAGKKVFCTDFDPQQTLSKWCLRRTDNHTVSSIECIEENISEWRKALEKGRSADVVIFDLPPGVDAYINDVADLCQSSDIVLVPSAMKFSDIDSVGPWIATLNEKGIHNAIIMNHANPRERFFKAARGELNKTGVLCPIEIRELADAHQHTIDGLTASDKPGCSSATDFKQVFDFVWNKLNISRGK